MSDVGHIIGGPVDPDYDGAVLTADLAIGDTLLYVDDPADFDEDAVERDARLIVGMDLDADQNLDATTGTFLPYLTYDDDAGTVTLAAPSTVAASSGDPVYIENPVSGLPAGRVTVMVAIDDSDTTGDALPAYLDVSLLESVGDVDLNDLTVDVEEDEDGQLYVSGFPGLAQRNGAVKFMQDALTATGPGDQTLTLSFVPIKNSEHLYWNGVYQPGSEWSRDQWTVTIPDPDGLVEAGDVLAMEYAYTDPTPAPPPPPPTMEFIGSTVVGNTTSAHLDLPDGTQQGDFLFVACGTGLLAGNQPSCDDPRMLIVRNDGDGDGHHLVCFGIEDGSGDPVLVEVIDGETNGSIVLATYRCSGSASTVSLGGGGDAALGSVPGDDPTIGILAISAGGTAPADGYDGWTRDVLGLGSGTFQAMWHNDGTTGFGLAGTGLWALISVGLMPGSGIAGI